MEKRRLIYIVDRDESARKGLTRLIQVAGYNVKSYASLEKFLQTHAIDTKACLILDAEETDLSAKKLQNTLKRKNIFLPIIFLTSTDDRQSRNKARLIEAISYFRKPVDGTALIDSITWAHQLHVT